MKEFRILHSTNTEIDSLLTQGWEITAAYQTVNGSCVALVPPMEFETLKICSVRDTLDAPRKEGSQTRDVSLDQELARLGSLGWELFQIISINNDFQRREYWLRRKKRARVAFASAAGTDGPTVS